MQESLRQPQLDSTHSNAANGLSLQKGLPPVLCATAKLEIPVELEPSTWMDAVRRITVDLAETPSLSKSAAPHAVRIPIAKPRVSVVSFEFDATGGSRLANPLSKNRRKTSTAETQPVRSSTRIRPPKDAIKLSDRLFYLLQPPIESLSASSDLSFPFEPFPYQYEGMAFLYPRYAAILADEMGLGKTMQSISTIRFLLLSGEIESVLLICPKPLVTNWQREFALWAPEIPIAIVEGNQEKRHWQWQQHVPVKIANYELLMRDEACIAGGTVEFDLVMLDEAQRIKNKNSTTSRVVRSISRKRSWALTGTPVENSPEDLVGIFEFLSPGYLKSHMSAKTMGAASKDYVLRRTKDKVLKDLPPKLFRDANLDLTPSQWQSYMTAEDDGVLHLNELGTTVTIQHVFELVLRLKQICNFDPVTGDSAKLERLVADLEEVAASGQKAIVFSQWVRTIEQIASRIPQFKPLQYHGKIPSKKRDAIIEEFRNGDDRSVLLMSYGAGSVGLNLQFCHYVFLFDRWWNPAVEDQAINRAHRIGVADTVTVTRMLAVNTIEERIHNVLEQKRELFATIFAETGVANSVGLSKDEVFSLFGLRSIA